MAVEEIKGITYDFAGERLDGWQAVQRLYLAGFTDVKVLAIGYAVMMGESGRYLKAWHHNVLRNADGTIARDVSGSMTVKSTDLGFIQKNITHSPAKVMPIEAAASQSFVSDLYEAYPELARGDEAAEIAWTLYGQRGWQPWYAHTNGSYKKGLPASCVAVANFLDRVLNRADGFQIKRKA